MRDPVALEAAQAVHLFGDDGAAQLRPIDWDAVGGEVYLERARGLVSAHGELLGSATAGGSTASSKTSAASPARCSSASPSCRSSTRATSPPR